MENLVVLKIWYFLKADERWIWLLNLFVAIFLRATGTQNELGVTFTFLTSTSDIVVRAQGGWEWDDPCFRVRHNVGAVSCLFSEYWGVGEELARCVGVLLADTHWLQQRNPFTFDSLFVSLPFFFKRRRQFCPVLSLGLAHVIPFCSHVPYHRKGHIKGCIWYAKIVSLVKRDGATQSFRTNKEWLCMEAQRLAISCGVPGGKEQGFVKRRKLELCGRTMTGRPKMQQRSGTIKKWKNRQAKAGKTNGKMHHNSERM